MRRLPYFMGAILTLLWIAPTTLHAQQTTGTIRGRITDNATQQGLPGVTAVNPLRFDYRNVRRPLWPLAPAES